MGSTLLLPDLRRVLAGLERRVGILERRIRPDDDSSITDDELVFTLPGALTVSTSPPVYLRRGGLVTSMRCSLGTAGTTTTTIVLKRGATTVATANLGSGVTLVDVGVRARWGADAETMTVAVTGAGTGAANLTAQVRY